MNKISGIYAIRNNINGKLYIGKSVNVNKRWKEHKYRLNSKNYKMENELLINAWHKCGREYFELIILEECPEQELGNMEVYYIALYGSKCPNGYNLTDGGDGGVSGYKMPQSTKDKISISRKGIKFTQEHRKKLREAKLGTHPNRVYDFKGENGLRFGSKLDNASSKYFGVYLSKNRGYTYWVAKITINRKGIHIGSFKLETEAAKAYDNYIVGNNINHPLNFPEDYN